MGPLKRQRRLKRKDQKDIYFSPRNAVIANLSIDASQPSERARNKKAEKGSRAKNVSVSRFLPRFLVRPDFALSKLRYFCFSKAVKMVPSFSRRYRAARLLLQVNQLLNDDKSSSKKLSIVARHPTLALKYSFSERQYFASLIFYGFFSRRIYSTIIILFICCCCCCCCFEVDIYSYDVVVVLLLSIFLAKIFVVMFCCLL